MADQQQNPPSDLAARLAALKSRSGRRRRNSDWIIRVGMIAMLLLPAAFGYFSYLFAADAWLAVSGAKSVQGKVSKIETETYTYRENNTSKTSTSYIIHVEFRGDGGAKRVTPLQHGGATDEDTRFARDLIDLDAYQPGTTVDLLYHPELDERIWLDDFRALWLLPLILGGAALVSGFLVLGSMVVLWPRR